jgi:short subunit fatty acids transporter
MAGLFRKMRMVLARLSMACPEPARLLWSGGLVEGKPKIVTKPKNRLETIFFWEMNKKIPIFDKNIKAIN